MSEENQVEESSSSTPVKGKFLGCGCLAWVLIGLFALLSFGLLVALLLPARCVAREAARRIQCRNNIRQIALALFNYTQEYKVFPPAYTVDEQGNPMHSWRVLILPFMEYKKDNVEYDFSQPWNSPHNIAFAHKSRAHEVYRCPTEFKDDQILCDTSYVLLVGPNAFAEGTRHRTYAAVRDGLSNTIMIGEMSHSGILWTEPRDLNVEEMSSRLNDPEQIGLRSDHSGGVQIGIGDGSVRWISNSIDPKLLEALITINGGEDMIEFHDW